MIGNPRLHRWGHAKGLVDAGEVVPRHVERHRGLVLVDPTTSPVVRSVALAPRPMADLADKDLDERTDRLVVVIALRDQQATVRTGHAD